MRSIDSCTQDCKSHFNRREYEQFIKPLIASMEDAHRQILNREINKRLNNIIDSTMIQAKEQANSFNEEGSNYIELSTLEEIIQKELNIYLV